MRLHVGLGSATQVDAIEIRWPERVKRVEKLGPVAADQFLVIREGSGIVTRSGPGGNLSRASDAAPLRTQAGGPRLVTRPAPARAGRFDRPPRAGHETLAH